MRTVAESEGACLQIAEVYMQFALILRDLPPMSLALTEDVKQVVKYAVNFRRRARDGA